MQFLEIISASYEANGSVLLEISADFGSRPETVPFALSETDNHGLAPDVRAALSAWVAAGNTIAAYVAPPAPPPPTAEEQRASMPSISPRQLRLALIGAGVSLASVDAAIAAIPDQAQREAAQVEWEYATTYVRTHPLIVSLTPALGLTDEQVDDLWQAAGAL